MNRPDARTEPPRTLDQAADRQIVHDEWCWIACPHDEPPDSHDTDSHDTDCECWRCEEVE